MTVLGKEFMKTSLVVLLGRTSVLRGIYCLHFVGNSPSSGPLVDGQFFTACRACCRAVSSVECPIPDLFAYKSRSQVFWSCNHLSQTSARQPSSEFVLGSLCWSE